MGNQQKLKGHRAVITGASSGIGYEYALQLAAMGADLVIAARRLDRLQELAKTITEKHPGVKVEAIQSDLCDPKAAKALYEAATAGGRPVTLLINNAGIGPYGQFLKTPVQEHLNTIQLNSVALTELCHRFASHMQAHGRQSYISNIASIAAYQGAPNFAVYAATKSFVRIFSEILRRELRSTQISVTCVCPGGTYTEFLDKAGQVLNDAGHGVMMSAEAVTRIGIDGMLKRKAIVIPGFLNWLSCVLPRFIPSGLALTFASLAMKRSVSERSATSS